MNKNLTDIKKIIKILNQIKWILLVLTITSSFFLISEGLFSLSCINFFNELPSKEELPKEELIQEN